MHTDVKPCPAVSWQRQCFLLEWNGHFQSTMMQKEKAREEPLVFSVCNIRGACGGGRPAGWVIPAPGAQDADHHSTSLAFHSLQTMLSSSPWGLHIKALLEINMPPKIVKTHTSLKRKYKTCLNISSLTLLRNVKKGLSVEAPFLLHFYYLQSSLLL